MSHLALLESQIGDRAVVFRSATVADWGPAFASNEVVFSCIRMSIPGRFGGMHGEDVIVRIILILFYYLLRRMGHSFAITISYLLVGNNNT